MVLDTNRKHFSEGAHRIGKGRLIPRQRESSTLWLVRFSVRFRDS